MSRYENRDSNRLTLDDRHRIARSIADTCERHGRAPVNPHHAVRLAANALGLTLDDLRDPELRELHALAEIVTNTDPRTVVAVVPTNGVGTITHVHHVPGWNAAHLASVHLAEKARDAGWTVAALVYRADDGTRYSLAPPEGLTP